MPVCYLKQKRMINKQLITRRFSRAVESYNREAVAQKQICLLYTSDAADD